MIHYSSSCSTSVATGVAAILKPCSLAPHPPEGARHHHEGCAVIFVQQVAAHVVPKARPRIQRDRRHPEVSSHSALKNQFSPHIQTLMERVILFLPLALLFSVVGCDSTVVDETPSPAADEAQAVFTITNSQGLPGPAPPDKVVVRLWRGPSDHISENNTVKLADFPHIGESREVTVNISPGLYWAGLIGYKESSGNAKLVAISENRIEFKSGESTSVNLSNVYRTYSADPVCRLIGSFEPNEVFRISTFLVDRSNAIFGRSAFDETLVVGRILYSTDPFTGESPYEPIRGGSGTSFFPQTDVYISEELTDTFYARVQYDLPSVWWQVDAGPRNITRPNLSEDAVNMIDTIKNYVPDKTC